MKLINDLGNEYPATVLSALIDVHEWIGTYGPEDVAPHATLVTDE